MKVACPVTMARDILAPLLKEFPGRYPDLRVEIEPSSSGWDQEPKEDVDVFFKLRAQRIPHGASGPTRAPFGGSSPPRRISERPVIQRLRVTCPVTVASVPGYGN
jgi:DNA-binding transcriptional LysR family regulator